MVKPLVVNLLFACGKSLCEFVQWCGMWIQCSAQVFKRAGCHLKRAHLARGTDRQKGTISAVNGGNGAQIAR